MPKGGPFPRVECPGCGRTVIVTQKGHFGYHKDKAGQPCERAGAKLHGS